MVCDVSPIASLHHELFGAVGADMGTWQQTMNRCQVNLDIPLVGKFSSAQIARHPRVNSVHDRLVPKNYSHTH